MNNGNMGGMNPMGAPVGGGMPMMNNGAAGVRPPMPPKEETLCTFNTYIYDYFLRNNMYDCAKALLDSDHPPSTSKNSPGRGDNGSSTGNGEDGDGDLKDNFDPKRPADLPDPNLPPGCPEGCFLYEWWCLFWDMFNAQRGKLAEGRPLQYFTHTQQQSRDKQNQQQMMLRANMGPNQMYPQGYNAQMIRNNAANGMSVNQQNDIARKAMQNNRNGQNATPAQVQMMQQAAKQQGMQRDPSGGNDQQRAQSPASAENAPSPSKRPRLEGSGFNPAPQMPNGRGNGGMPQQFQNTPGNPQANASRIAGYQASLGHQQQQQMPNAKAMPNGPQSQGSPMMTQGQQDGSNNALVANYYNPQDMQNGGRPGQGQTGQQSGNHALQDYQMQLMLLEQQNKKRLMMARQEQDSMMPRPDGQGPPPGGPNGQPFQQGTSPQGARSVNSPNPGDQLKRTPHMNPAQMPSPLPEGQSRGSPSGNMNFSIPGGNPMDPNMNSQYMVGGVPNGMRPPSSHPNGFNGINMTPQQIAMARQQQAAQGQGWQGGPNAQMMPQGQGVPQQGTPQQRNMPPPSAVPAAGAANVNGRAQPASPQPTAAPPTPNQSKKAPPKGKADKKGTEAKRATKKGSTANLNAGATPSADAENTGATPTPATPITPVHKQTFAGQNGAVQAPTNGQPAASANPSIGAPDPLQGGMGFPDNSFGVDFNGSMDFANPNNGSMDVLQDFDFDSFLHQDAEGVNDFNFDTSAFLTGDGNEIGAD